MGLQVWVYSEGGDLLVAIYWFGFAGGRGRVCGVCQGLLGGIYLVAWLCMICWIEFPWSSLPGGGLLGQVCVVSGQVYVVRFIM